MNRYLLGGRYRLADRIAAGGMGEVWRGSDELLGRPVAVKLLSAARAGDEAFRERFRAEARYAASLSHPGIAQVYDYGETGGEPHGGAYLVMELVTGEALSAALARHGRLSAGATLDVVGQAARALQVAHSAGIVHRDIKPGNLLVTTEGLIKITDFGIARALRAAQAGHLTQAGMVMGTARYVSPEQASGLDVGAASDIYSLGVVAYECLAGQAPFAAEAPIAVALAHVHAPVPPLPASVPGAVSDLVMAMLAKRAQDRPGSARLISDRAWALLDTLPMRGEAVNISLMGADAGAPDNVGDPAAWFPGDHASRPTSPGTDGLHGTTWQAPRMADRTTVLAWGDDPPAPPRLGIAWGDDPPAPPRLGIARGDDAPRPPRPPRQGMAGEDGFPEHQEWAGRVRPVRSRRARRTVFITATLGMALAGLGIAAAVMMLNGHHGSTNGKTIRPGAQANRTAAGPLGSPAAGGPATLIAGGRPHGRAAHAGRRSRAKTATSGTGGAARHTDSGAPVSPTPTVAGSPSPTVTESPTLSATPSAQPSSTP